MFTVENGAGDIEEELNVGNGEGGIDRMFCGVNGGGNMEGLFGAMRCGGDRLSSNLALAGKPDDRDDNRDLGNSESGGDRSGLEFSCSAARDNEIDE